MTPKCGALSPAARQGLAYARELAEAARARSLSALKGLSDAALTVEALAEDYGSPVKIRTQIKQARIELFGRDLSDSAIAYRLRKRRERGERTCAEADCEATIPALASGRQRFCPEHGTPGARVRRHRTDPPT